MNQRLLSPNWNWAPVAPNLRIHGYRQIQQAQKVLPPLPGHLMLSRRDGWARGAAARPPRFNVLLQFIVDDGVWLKGPNCAGPAGTNGHQAGDRPYVRSDVQGDLARSSSRQMVSETGRSMIPNPTGGGPRLRGDWLGWGGPTVGAPTRPPAGWTWNARGAGPSGTVGSSTQV